MIRSTSAPTVTTAAGRLSLPNVLLRVEGAAVLIAAVAVYFYRGYSWQLFLLLLFAPDLAMLGYVAGSRVGSVVYNLAHLAALPLALGVTGWALGSAVAVQVALIWLAHIGLDRMVGYGLKYPDAFKHTHLQEV